MQNLDMINTNESHYYLEIPSLESERVSVLSYSCQDHDVSDDYRFEVVVELSDNPDPIDLKAKPVTFKVASGDDFLSFHGVIVEVSYTSKRVDGHEYVFVISSPLHALKFNRQNRVFLNKSSKSIVEEVLLGSGFSATSFEFKTKYDYVLREFTIQYDESDYDFILRLMDHDGMFYIFTQDEQQAKLCIYDDVEDMPTMSGDSEVMFKLQAGEVRDVETVFTLRRESRLLTDSVSFKDYNYRTPEAALEVSQVRNTEIIGQGIEYRYAENYKTIDQGAYIAKIRQQTLDWQRDVFVLESDCRGFTPGAKFTLIDHPDNSINGDYRILELEHFGDQRVGQSRGENTGGLTYRNRALVIKCGLPYRHPYENNTSIQGIFTAKIETTGGEYAYLDDQGRYRLRMPFDLSTASDGEASHSVRLMQSYTGQNYGMHFPLHSGTEVAVVCTNGDPDRPVILGVTANPDTPSTSTSANNSENVLRTWGGNELSMKDRKGLERVDLFTRDKKNILTLDAHEEGNSIRLATEEGDMLNYAKKTMLLESGDTQTVQVGNDHNVLVKNKQTLITKNKKIEMQSATDIKLEAGENILMQAETEDFTFVTAKDMMFDVKKDLSIDVRNENLEMLVSSGQSDIQAAKAISIKGSGGGLLHVGQGSGAVEVSTGGNLTVDGPTVTLTAPTINIRGNAVGNN